MKAGIIAAGTGERMTQGGIFTPKPMICVGGEPLIARAIRAAASVGVTSIACIINDLTPELDRYLRTKTWPVPLEIVKKTTPSSMESLFTLAPLLAIEPFLLFTVDAVFPFASLKRFLTKGSSLPDAQGVLALTRFVDDEKPLRVKTDRNHRVSALGDAAGTSRYVTAGFYYFEPSIFYLVESARARGLNALRQFLGLLLDREYRLYGIPVSKTVDVDHPEDIETAERYLTENARGDVP
ncbi:MAG TPA: NDP-sugar synthase [Syntrophorhabdales bacterium]|nr:NDP-sugar synthase [Syntrophorhabdales bacterium]